MKYNLAAAKARGHNIRRLAHPSIAKVHEGNAPPPPMHQEARSFVAAARFVHTLATKNDNIATNTHLNQGQAMRRSAHPPA